MRATLKRLIWADYLILACLAALGVFVWLRIAGTLNYTWAWERIPNYILRWDETTGRWLPNLLLQGLITTIRISLYAGLLALVLGVGLGLARVSRNAVLRMLARTYLELLRNIPPVVVVFIFYFFLSEQIIAATGLEGWARGIARRPEGAGLWGLFFGDMRRFPELMSGVIVLALFESAFVGEIVRAGIESVGRGQREAGASLGLTRMDTMRFVVLPQAMKSVTPPLANQFISLVKDSSIISLISVQDLTYKTGELVASTRMIFEAWITAAGLYFLLCFSLSLLFRRLERRPDRR
ncbi:amino acid ABC transporter permease [Paracoccaceae bacterium Fryx2]|nr:amino acid ABC transporter permease [Paracoccaceae bacterium Fryx2]